MALIELQRFQERQRTLQGAKRHPFMTGWRPMTLHFTATC